MGCDCARFSATWQSQGEEIVQTYEVALGYRNLPFEVIVTSFRDHSVAGSLTTSELKAALHDLGLPVKGMESSDSPLYVFYQQLSANGVHSLRSLVVLTVMLAEGGVRKKTDALYCLYDPEMTHMITDADVTEVIQEICDIGVLYITLFAELQAGSLRDEGNLRKVKRYNIRLAQGYFNLVHALVAAVVRNRKHMTYEEFVDTVVNQAPYLVNTKELRSKAIAAGISTQQEQEIMAKRHMRTPKKKPNIDLN